MKDAKGHGSNPRGAHSVGTQMVGVMPLLKASASGSLGTHVTPPKDTADAGGVQAFSLGSLRATQPWWDENDDKRVKNIQKAMRNGEKVPPISVTSYQGLNLIVDGHHRVVADVREGKPIMGKFVSPNSYGGRLAIDGARGYLGSPDWKWGGHIKSGLTP